MDAAEGVPGGGATSTQHGDGAHMLGLDAAVRGRLEAVLQVVEVRVVVRRAVLVLGVRQALLTPLVPPLDLRAPTRTAAVSEAGPEGAHSAGVCAAAP